MALNRKIYFSFFLLLLLLLRIYFNLNASKPFNNGDLIRITSKVMSEPIRYEYSQYIKLRGLKIYLPLYPEISYGDTVVIEGKVIEDKLDNPKLLKLEVSYNFLFNFRKNLLTFYDSSLSNPHSALIAGMVIGSKSGISQDFWDKLKYTGTAHVVVASGMNVTLIGGFLITFLTIFLKRRSALILALLGIWFYALMSGFDAPIVRAAIMGSLVFTAQEIGRINYALRTLIISAYLMLMVRPDWVTDLGFLLSFFATLSLILFQKKVGNLIKSVPVIIREDLSTTLSAQIGVTPILYFAFGQLNILSPVINVMILWTVPFITIIGMLSGIVGIFIPLLGRGIIYLAYPLTTWFIFVVTNFAKI